LVTTREAPLFDERGTGGNVKVICPTVQAESVRQTGTTGSLGMGGMREITLNFSRRADDQISPN
ncbi:MAG: hypothetical protein WA418_01250, partial [Bradyrhizobium sp.]